jgi:peptidoglycan/xylan/chitin deacetylase (PgdA/CDA1 family)
VTALGRTVALAGGAAAAVQIVPAATWLPSVRTRLAPRLASPMPAGTLAVTFDDGPHPIGTPAILDALDDLGWPATFFVLGSAADDHPDVVRETVRRGHAVGVHGYHHRYLIGRSPAAQARDLARAIDTVAAITGNRPTWWRPPYGVLSGPSLLAARRHGVRPLLWSAWAKDWLATATPDTIVDEVTSGRLDGGTLLLHDSDATSSPDSWRRTLGALPLLAQRVAAAGLQVQPLPR